MEGERERGKDGGREGEWGGWRKRGRVGRMEGERERGKDGGREGEWGGEREIGRVGRMEEERQRGKDGGRLTRPRHQQPDVNYIQVLEKVDFP